MKTIYVVSYYDETNEDNYKRVIRAFDTKEKLIEFVSGKVEVEADKILTLDFSVMEVQ